MTSITKNPHPPTKNFFLVQTRRLAESFELLTGSVVLTRPEKFLCKTTCDPAVFAWNAWINLGAKGLNVLYGPKDMASHTILTQKWNVQ